MNFIFGFLYSIKSTKFLFHNLDHTKSVVLGIETLCKAEKLDEETTTVLLLSGWFHDSGYVECYDNHEKQSVAIALKFLKDNDIDDSIQEKVAELIMATKFDYSPSNKLEKIIKDADNIHLADKNYPNTLQQLRDEWELSSNKKYCNEDWYHLNVDFLKRHQYYTKFAKDNWQNLKELNLNIIEQKLQNQ